MTAVDPWAEFAPAAQATASAGADPWAEFKLVVAAPTIQPGTTGGMPTFGGDAPAIPLTAADQQIPINDPRVTQDLKDMTNATIAGVPFADRAKAGLESVTGIGGTQGDYAGNLAAERVEAANRAQRLNGGEGVGNFIGSMAMPLGVLGKVAQGANVAQRAIRGALAGGAIGGIQGLSNTDNLAQPNWQDVGKSAAVGAGVGAAVPVIGAGAGNLYRMMADRLTGNVPNMATPAREMMTRALMSDDPALVQKALSEYGPHAMPLDAGPSLQGIGMGIGSGQPSDARSLLIQALTGRNAGTNDRLNTALDTALGPAQSPMAASAALQAQRSAIHGQLPQIFANAPPVDTSAVLSTIGTGLNKAVGPEAAVLAKARNWLMDEIPGGQGAIPVQDAERLQNAKMAIDTLIDRGDPTLGVPAGAVSRAQGAIGQVRQQLNQALRDQVPGYGNVMDQSSSLARQMEGIEAGKGTVLAGGQNALHPADYAAQFGALSPEEQAAQRLGIRANIDQAVGTKANDLQAVKQVLQGDNGWNAQKMGTAFGPQAAGDVSNAANAEASMRGSFNKIVENSQTAPRQAMVRALQEAAPAPQPLIPSDLRNVTALGGPLELARKGVNAVASAFRSAPDFALRDSQLARAITTQGPERDELIRQLLQANANRSQNAIAGGQVNNAASLASVLGANAALNGPSQRQPQR